KSTTSPVPSVDSPSATMTSRTAPATTPGTSMARVGTSARSSLCVGMTTLSIEFQAPSQPQRPPHTISRGAAPHPQGSTKTVQNQRGRRRVHVRNPLCHTRVLVLFLMLDYVGAMPGSSAASSAARRRPRAPGPPAAPDDALPAALPAEVITADVGRDRRRG